MGVGGIIGLIFGLLFGIILLGMSFFCYRFFTFSFTVQFQSSNRRPSQKVADSSRSSSKRNSGDLKPDSSFLNTKFVNQQCSQAMRAKETPCCPLADPLSGTLNNLTLFFVFHRQNSGRPVQPVQPRMTTFGGVGAHFLFLLQFEY